MESTDRLIGIEIEVFCNTHSSTRKPRERFRIDHTLILNISHLRPDSVEWTQRYANRALSYFEKAYPGSEIEAYFMNYIDGKVVYNPIAIERKISF